MNFFPVTKFCQFARSLGTPIIKKAGNYAQKSPGFKFFALRLLRRFPGLEQKLRSIYLGYRLANQYHSVNVSAPQIAFVKKFDLEASEGKEYPLPSNLSDGINAQQRSPLEINFHAYRGR